MRLIRFPGELPSAGTPFIHSFVLLVVFVAYEVAETASRRGDGAVVPFEGMLAGFRSGDWTEGEDESEVGSLLGINLPAACFVTAATTPPPSLPFFLSFFAPGIRMTWTA